MLMALLKFSFAGGIFYWLINSGRLDMSIIKKSISMGPNFYFTILMLLCSSVFLGSLRWKLILEVKTEEKIPFKKILPIHWIGLFFSAFLPGVVTGDVVKLLYVKDLSPKFDRAFLFTSVVMDRIIGLCGLLFLSGLITLFNYNSIIELSDKIRPVIHFNLLLFSGALGFIIILFLPDKLHDMILPLFKKIPIIGKKIFKLVDQTWLIGKDKATTLKALTISLFVHTISIFSIWIITHPFYNVPVGVSDLFGFIPIGFVTTSIPIAPSGAGVGHYIFDELFGLVGVKGGASLFNLYFICILTINLLGVIPYLFFGKKHSLKEAEELAEEQEQEQEQVVY